MIEVHGPADLAVGDQVEVSEYSSTRADKVRRGVVEKVGKVAAEIRFSPVGTIRVCYRRKVTERVFRRRETRIFRPIRKLTAYDIWREQEPHGSVAWSVGHSDRTIVIHSSTVRDNVESAISALRAYRTWLHLEPKEES